MPSGWDMLHDAVLIWKIAQIIFNLDRVDACRAVFDTLDNLIQTSNGDY
jgi:hypothetical protein